MQKKVIQCNKLVRDYIPEIIAADGRKCSYEVLSRDRYIELLDEKLNEELSEYQESKSLEELADLVEVIVAVINAMGFSWEDLTTIRTQKLVARGGFKNRIFLKEIIEET